MAVTQDGQVMTQVMHPPPIFKTYLYKGNLLPYVSNYTSYLPPIRLELVQQNPIIFAIFTAPVQCFSLWTTAWDIHFCQTF